MVGTYGSGKPFERYGIDIHAQGWTRSVTPVTACDGGADRVVWNTQEVVLGELAKEVSLKDERSRLSRREWKGL